MPTCACGPGASADQDDWCDWCRQALDDGDVGQRLQRGRHGEHLHRSAATTQDQPVATHHLGVDPDLERRRQGEWRDPADRHAGRRHRVVGRGERRLAHAHATSHCAVDVEPCRRQHDARDQTRRVALAGHHDGVRRLVRASIRTPGRTLPCRPMPDRTARSRRRCPWRRAQRGPVLRCRSSPAFCPPAVAHRSTQATYRRSRGASTPRSRSTSWSSAQASSVPRWRSSWRAAAGRCCASIAARPRRRIDQRVVGARSASATRRSTAVLTAWESAPYWHRWADHLGVVDPDGMASFVRTGMLIFDAPGGTMPRVADLWDDVGMPYERLTPDEVAQRFPALDVGSYFPPKTIDDPAFGDDAVGRLSAVFDPNAGYIDDPLLAAHNIAHAARHHGAEFRFHQRVVDVAPRRRPRRRRATRRRLVDRGAGRGQRGRTALVGDQPARRRHRRHAHRPSVTAPGGVRGAGTGRR